jgi:hypothetical protein
MNYTASVSDYFKSPKWMMNTLLAGVCVFIPIVGQIVVKGWLLTGFWGRDDERPEGFPDFDFNKFGQYLERGRGEGPCVHRPGGDFSTRGSGNGNPSFIYGSEASEGS